MTGSKWRPPGGSGGLPPAKRSASIPLAPPAPSPSLARLRLACAAAPAAEGSSPLGDSFCCENKGGRLGDAHPRLGAKTAGRARTSAADSAGGIPLVRFHYLRHTAASEMLRRGFLLREVQYVLLTSRGPAPVSNSLGRRPRSDCGGRKLERYAHFAKTFKPPKSLSWSVQQSVMHETRQAGRSNPLKPHVFASKYEQVSLMAFKRPTVEAQRLRYDSSWPPNEH